MSEAKTNSINEIANGADLVTVQHGTRYYNLYYFFTNPVYNKIERYRNSVGYKYYNPMNKPECISGFLYWQVKDNKISADTTDIEGLTSNISAFMHNFDTYDCTITPNDGISSHNPYFIDEQLLKSYDDIIQNLSVFRYSWLSDYTVIYENNYPSIILNVSAALDNHRFDHWNLSSHDANYIFNELYLYNEVIEIPTELTIYPSFVKISKLKIHTNPEINLEALDLQYDTSSIVRIDLASCDHYTFDKWTNTLHKIPEELSDSSTLVVILSDDELDLVANYNIKSYDLCLHTIDNNGLMVDSNISIGNFSNLYLYKSLGSSTITSYIYNTSADIIADFNDSTKKYRFISWSDGILDRKRRICMNLNLELCALYAFNNQYKLNALVMPPNSGMTMQSNSDGLYYSGDSPIILTIPTTVDYDFVCWSDKNTETVRILDEMYSSTTISAIYEKNRNIITNYKERIILISAENTIAQENLIFNDPDKLGIFDRNCYTMLKNRYLLYTKSIKELKLDERAYIMFSDAEIRMIDSGLDVVIQVNDSSSVYSKIELRTCSQSELSCYDIQYSPLTFTTSDGRSFTTTIMNRTFRNDEWSDWKIDYNSIKTCAEVEASTIAYKSINKYDLKLGKYFWIKL